VRNQDFDDFFQYPFLAILKKLAVILTKDNDDNNQLNGAISYSVLNGGKRSRHYS
jgi:geranylgeranyl pyrophosphate synthase